MLALAETARMTDAMSYVGQRNTLQFIRISPGPSRLRFVSLQRSAAQRCIEDFKAEHEADSTRQQKQSSENMSSRSRRPTMSPSSMLHAVKSKSIKHVRVHRSARQTCKPW